MTKREDVPDDQSGTAVSGDDAVSGEYGVAAGERQGRNRRADTCRRAGDRGTGGGRRRRGGSADG